LHFRFGLLKARELGQVATGSKRKAVSWLGVVFSAALLIVVFSAPAFAVHDTGIFQLDGDASSSTQPLSPPALDDWDKVCHQYAVPANCPASTDTTGSTSGAWTSEPNPSASIFTGGGSKDPQDITNWAWKDAGGLPDKDNLLHAFAVRYSLDPAATCPSGGAAKCEVIFFGSDRLDNSGDAQQGFWFLKSKVGLGTNSVGGGTGFTGSHQAGDILVISDFSNGGTTSTITVYKWDPSCTATNKPDGACGDANLRRLETSDAAKCSAAAGVGDPFCGIVNAGTITMPWTFVDKSGTPGNGALNGEFYEAGINLSTLGLAGECFSSMVAETRSSTSTTATLKDFVVSSFGKCESGLVTTAKDGSGGTIPAGGLSIGTGSVSVKDSANLTVNGISTWNGTLSFFLCGPSDTDNCVSGGTSISSGPVSNSTTMPVLSAAATVTSVGRYCWRGTFTSGTSGLGDATDNGATNPNECFTVNPVTPTLATAAGAGPVLLGNPVTDTAALSGTASQPGSPVINGPVGAAAGGSITFTLYGPGNCTTVATGTGTNPQTVSVTGNATYGPVSFTPNHVGTFHWVATYSGNLPNTLGTSHNTACDDTAEDVTVKDTSTANSEQYWFPNDTATVSSDHGALLNGTLSIQLYAGTTTCASGKEVSGQVYSKPVVNVTSATVDSGSQITYKVKVTDDVSWLVTFTSTDPNVDGSSHCESSSLTITN